MKAGKYNIRDLFSNRYIQQIVIPEIQRDYVWGEEQVTGLMNSILEDFQKYSTRPDVLTHVGLNDPDIKNAFNEFYRKRKYASNIGFIYAYSDEQYPGQYFLIDGQQRITTIFFMLLVLSTKKEGLKSKYQSTYTIDGKLKLDYRVRESAHEFATDYVMHILAGKNDFRNSNFYFDNKYDNDKTVSCILKNVGVLNAFVDSLQGVDIENLYSYVEELVDFWYFDTNISEQGEELYIYMNARGEQVQGNENIKADLLGKLPTTELKNSYGIKWEEWQDLFWKKKGKNNNSDKGFNQFLCCIAGLEYYLRGDKSKIYSKDAFEKIKEVRTADIIAVLSLEIIEEYFDAIAFLFERQEEFRNTRHYSDWVPKALESFWSLLNNATINWFADYTDDDRATERRAMVYEWSVLLFIRRRPSELPITTEVFRLLRIYYVRFHNNIRAVWSISSEVDLQLKSGIWKETLYDDERLKFNFLENCKPDERKELEELIWQIEDHPYNLNGQDVGNVNISHLVDFDQDGTVRTLESIRDKFNEVFPEKYKKHHGIKHVLLYYGEYYDESSPHYYLNLKFENWRRVIRGIKHPLVKGHNPFLEFFHDFKSSNLQLDEFIQEKDLNIMTMENALTLHDRLLWYSQNLGKEMWHEGGAIAISKGNQCSLPDWESKDANFPSEYIFYNTKGDLKGGCPRKLSTLIQRS
jgi:uncharacterized protein with ParB-like and HNH nuclease domain